MDIKKSVPQSPNPVIEQILSQKAIIPPLPLNEDLKIFNNGNLMFQTGLRQHALGLPPSVVLESPQLNAVHSLPLHVGNVDPIEVHFRSLWGGVETYPQAAFIREVTLDLFTREPTEYEGTLVAAAPIQKAPAPMPDQWVREMSSSRLYPQGESSWMEDPYLSPNAVTIGYTGKYPNTYTIFKVAPSDFWQVELPPPGSPPSPIRGPTLASVGKGSRDGPGAWPLGEGSVKTIRVVAHDICEVEVPIQQILNGLKLSISRAVGQACSGANLGLTTGGVAWITTASLNTLSGSSFLRPNQETGRNAGSHFIGGFYLWAEAEISARSFIGPLSKLIQFLAPPFSLLAAGFSEVPHGNTKVQIGGNYTFILDDGFLQVKYSSPGAAIVDGSQDLGMLLAAVAEELLAGIADRLNIVLKDQQKKDVLQCNATGGFTAIAVQDHPCREAMISLRQAARIGAENIFGANNVPNALIDSLGSSTPINPIGVHDPNNWETALRDRPIFDPKQPSTLTPCFGQCALGTCLPDDPSVPLFGTFHCKDCMCRFIVRVNSLIANPDSVDVGLFESIFDRSPNGGATSGVIAFLAAMSNLVPGFSFSSLCNRPMVAPSEFLARYYATIHEQRSCNRDQPGFGDPWYPGPDEVCDKCTHYQSSQGPWHPSCDRWSRCSNASCKVDSDCYAFEQCIDGLCFGPYSPCNTNQDCQPNQLCLSGGCVSFGGKPCDLQDPFGPDCPSNRVCENSDPVRPWLPGPPFDPMCRQK